MIRLRTELHVPVFIVRIAGYCTVIPILNTDFEWGPHGRFKL
jgi:hypothetical protein